MLRQLARLTRRVPAAGPRALAIAIYGDGEGHALEAPGEGVACVDDAARAVELLALVWQANQSPWIHRWALGLLDFVLWMHQGDGLWVNFISNWEGDLNRDGVTSAPGVNFWQARGLSAAVTGATILGQAEAESAALAGLAAAAGARPAPDVRSIQLLALGRWMDGGRAGQVAGRQDDWAEEIAACRIDRILMNSPEERGTPHLWGHVQEAALSQAGVALGRRDLIELAEASASALFSPIIEGGFPAPHVQPYDVQSAIEVMDALAAATGRVGYAELAGLARAWFSGRNPSGAAVYDRVRGLVADGVDDSVVSLGSGAESNIVGGLALPEAAAAVSFEGEPEGHPEYAEWAPARS
ncbi:MAG TPA: hypothetical protein VNI34_06045 [Candidatus Nitrosotalea sp.]|nr:hypothetical protein [Candidatus Nitrosotalea sp.]